MLSLAFLAGGLFALIDRDQKRIENEAAIEKLQQEVAFEYWSDVDDTHGCIRFVTAWHTTEEEVEALLTVLRQLV